MDDVLQDYSDSDCHNGLYFANLFLFYCRWWSVIIASNPGFLSQIFLAALEKNRNRNPGLDASDIIWQCAAIMASSLVMIMSSLSCWMWLLITSSSIYCHLLDCVYTLMKYNTITGPLCCTDSVICLYKQWIGVENTFYLSSIYMWVEITVVLFEHFLSSGYISVYVWLWSC